MIVPIMLLAIKESAVDMSPFVRYQDTEIDLLTHKAFCQEDGSPRHPEAVQLGPRDEGGAVVRAGEAAGRSDNPRHRLRRDGLRGGSPLAPHAPGQPCLNPPARFALTGSS